jgi:hypothetical protein
VRLARLASCSVRVIVPEGFSGFSKAVVAETGNDHVIQNMNSQQTACGSKSLRHRAIFGTRGRISAGMVVYEYERGGRASNGVAKNLARMDQTRGQRPDRHLFRPDQPMSTVDEQHMKRLSPKISQLGSKMALNVRRTADQLPRLDRQVDHASCQLDCGTQARRFGGPQSGRRFERRSFGRCESTNPIEAVQNGARERTRILCSISGPEDQREDLGVREPTRTCPAKAFARTIGGGPSQTGS